MQRQHLEDNCESIDATVFSSDMLWCAEDREMLKMYATRWLKAINVHEATMVAETAESEGDCYE